MADSLRTVILQEIKSRFPTISWKLGSVVRSIVVEPVLALADIVTSYVNKAEADMDINTCLKEPALHTDAIDLWMSRLGLTEPDKRTAKGTVKLIKETDAEMLITSGTMFYWNGVRLSVTESTTWGGSGQVYKQLSRYGFEAEVPVETDLETSLFLDTGTPINWDNAPTDVYDIVVGSPISGGSGGMTAQDKATLVANAMTAQAYSGEDCIRKALMLQYPLDIADVSAGRDNERTNPHAIQVYVKPATGASVSTLTLPVQKRGDRTFVSFSGCGVLQVTACYDSFNVKLDDTEYSASVTGGAWGDSEATVTIQLNTATTLTGSSIAVEVVNIPVYARVRSTLDSAQRGTPYNFCLSTPIIAKIGLDTGASEIIDTTTASNISAYINAKPLDATITGNEIRTILSQAGYTDVGAVIFKATVYCKGQSRVLSRVDSISLSGEYGTQGIPVALYCTTDGIVTG